MALDALLGLLGIVGIALGVYMAAMQARVRSGQEVRCLDGACPVVMRTKYAATFGFPNSYVALPYYLAVASFAGLNAAGIGAGLLPWLIAASAASLVMSAYLLFGLVKLQRW